MSINAGGAPVDPSVVLIPMVGDTDAYVDYVRLNFVTHAWDGKLLIKLNT